MTRLRRRKQLVQLGLALLFVGLSVYLQHQPEAARPIIETLPAGTYRVTEFIDGDTISVDMNGTKETIRMIGVDTPETKDPRKPVQCFGQAASDFTKQLIGKSPVRLEADPENTNRDRYNRLLRYVFLPDGRLVNAEIIKAGYGFAYTNFPFTRLEEFRSYEATAKAESKGLWGECETSSL